MDNQSQPVNDQTSQVPPILPVEPPKPSKHILISTIAVLLFLGATATAAYFYLQTQSLKTELAQSSPTPATQDLEPEMVSPTTDPTQDWQLYNSTDFSFKYPSKYTQNNGYSSGPINNTPRLIVALTDPETVREGTDAPFNGLTVYSLTLKSNQTLLQYLATEKKSFENSTLGSTKPSVIQNQTVFETQTWYSLDIPNRPNITVYYTQIPNSQTVIAISQSHTNDSFGDIFSQILSTFQFTDATSPPPTSTSTTISYSLPSGWQTATDPTNTYQVGFDPTTQTAAPNPDSADPQALWVTTKNTNNSPYYSPLASSTIFSLKPYNGGSRHTFLESIIFNEPLSLHNTGDNFLEKNYTIQGKSCLVLYGLIDMSGGYTTVGMCALSSTQALSFSTFANQDKTETLLATLKFN